MSPDTHGDPPDVVANTDAGEPRDEAGAPGWLSAAAAPDLAAVLTLVLVAIHTEGRPRLALALAFAGAQRREVLRANARLLVGLTFAFATLWKLTSRDFLDGSFFHYLLANEERIGVFAEPLLSIQQATRGRGYLPRRPARVGSSEGRDPADLPLDHVPPHPGGRVRDGARRHGLRAVGGAGCADAPTSSPFAALPLFVAVTSVPQFPVGFEMALIGAVMLVGYLVVSHRAVLVLGCALLGAGMGAVASAGLADAAVALGAGVGLLAATFLDLVARRPVNTALAGAGVVVSVIAGLFLLL